MSSERSQCFDDSEGRLSIVNLTFDNYLAVFVGGSYSASGRVGVCHDGVYSSVCDANWDQKDANVLCNGFGFGSSFFGE